jgi:hypothetical protein
MRALVVVAALAACSPATKRCKEGTLFIAVTLAGAAGSADLLLVDVSLDGGTPQHTELPHTPGTAMGGIEIDFPGGYPKGRSAAVTLTATNGGTPVASDSQTITLNNACDALALVLTPGETGDLAGLDFAGLDLQGLDMAVAPDLQLPDLVTFVDLINCMPTTEECFNNADDDCDGLIDCADPDCTNGGSPIATCVPDPASFAVGIFLPGSVGCPTSYPSPSPLGSNFSAASCATGTCSGPSTPSASRCGAGLFSAAAADCGAYSTVVNVSTTTSCVPFTPVPGGTYHFQSGPFWQHGGCAPTGGTAQKTPAAFAAHDTFCARPSFGSGCELGKVCVPAASTHCVLKAGAQLACPGNYILRTTRYFTNLDDPVTCACNSTLTANGDCTGVLVHYYTSTSCGPAGFPLPNPNCDNADISALNGAQTVGTPPSLGACTTGANAVGTSAPLDEQTVCCLP